MPLQKNQLLTLRIERLSSGGTGVALSRRGSRPSSLPPPLRCVSSRTAAGMPSAFWTNCSPFA